MRQNIVRTMLTLCMADVSSPERDRLASFS
jgi:hypothetical protein